MIIEKETEATVIQEYDTELKQFVSQRLIVANEIVYSANREDDNGFLIEDSNLTHNEFELINNDYLPYDMVQPKIEYDILDIKNSHLYNRLNNMLCEVHDCNIESQAARDMLIRKILETV